MAAIIRKVGRIICALVVGDGTGMESNLLNSRTLKSIVLTQNPVITNAEWWEDGALPETLAPKDAFAVGCAEARDGRRHPGCRKKGSQLSNDPGSRDGDPT